MKRLLFFIPKLQLFTFFSLLIIILSCSNSDEVSKISSDNIGPPTGNIDQSKEYTAKFNTEVGSFTVVLYDDKVPYTVENFVTLSKSGYYNKTTFHRVIPGFMVQGGDPTATGAGNPGYRFSDEFHVDLRHDSEGILSMANSGVNTNGSQFFITLEAQSFLDAFEDDNTPKNCQNMRVSCHAVFGKVIEGMDVVKAIRSRDPATDTSPGTVIENIEIITK